MHKSSAALFVLLFYALFSLSAFGAVSDRSTAPLLASPPRVVPPNARWSSVLISCLCAPMHSSPIANQRLS